MRLVLDRGHRSMVLAKKGTVVSLRGRPPLPGRIPRDAFASQLSFRPPLSSNPNSLPAAGVPVFR